jgi:NADH:ubiquinone oxidoreductase subunit 6 (subunit J)
MSDVFWFELKRGFIYTVPVILVYLGAVMGAVVVLGIALWGYNIIIDDRQPLIHYIWISSMVLILVCVIVWFLEKVFSIL